MEGRLVGERVRLAPVDPEKHLEGCYRWMNDPEIIATLSVGTFPMSRMAEKGWLEAMAKGPAHDVTFAIELIETGEHIGMSGVHQIHWVTRTALTGSLIGRRDLHGKGVGTEAFNLRTRYCFETLNLTALYSEFLDGNLASRRMQEKGGYRIWGVKPKAIYKGGRSIDCVQTVLLREEWEQARKPLS
jgi:RimJ/RimL family protein N-acetyltransferase